MGQFLLQNISAPSLPDPFPPCLKTEGKMLTLEQAAIHWNLSPDTLRRKIKAGELSAVRIKRRYRLDWPNIWACERGPLPQGARADLYKLPLLSKQKIAASLQVSLRSVERWIVMGMPTRTVFGSVRANPLDVTEWLHQNLDMTLAPEWWRS
jgi:excisionase family DNA binding protein